MVNTDLIRNKLGQLAEYYQDLEEIQEVVPDEFRTDKKVRRFVERTLHLTIECCLDIGSHIIADNNWREPIDKKDIFTVLVENGLFTKELLPKLQRMAQFRNVLVHDYAKIDPDIVYKILRDNLLDIREFIRTIEQIC